MAANELNCPKCGLHMGGREGGFWMDRARWYCKQCNAWLQFSALRRMRNHLICGASFLSILLLLEWTVHPTQNTRGAVALVGVLSVFVVDYFLPQKVVLVES